MAFFQGNEKQAFRSPLAGIQCENCSHIQPLIERVALGIQQIEVAIRRGVTGTQHSWSQDEAGGVVSPHDFKELHPRAQLEWSLVAIDQIIHNLGQVSSFPEPQLLGLRLQGQPGSDHSTPYSSGPSRTNTPRAEWRQSGRGQSLSSEAVHNLGDTGAVRSKISNIEAPQPLNRMLPSLPSLASSLATKDSHPGSPQILQTPDPATNNVQVQYLRREVSAKNVALQALQRDYDNLLANASFQQTHHPASTTGADAPSSWAEERINLQYQVGDLQAQVNDLIKTREEAQKESIASRNQYLQIMSMSSQLQTQTAADVKRWQAEKEEWEKQRLNLLRTIQRLERQVRRTGTGADEDEQHVDDGSVNHLLRGDIEKLEQSCRFLENRMRELDQETAQLDGALRTALHISTSLREKLDQARSESQA